MVREPATKHGVRLSLELAPGVDLVDGDERRLLPGDLQPALERGQVHTGGRERRGRVVPDERRGAGVGDGHRAGHRARGPRADLRGVPADRRRRRAGRGHRASGSRCRSGSSSCTAAGSGSKASPAAAAASPLRCRWRTGAAMAGELVLVVEDNEKNMKLFRDVLRGHRVQHARGDDGRGGGRARACRRTRRSC